jgi:transposase/very-short-patch-repair endonuclease
MTKFNPTKEKLQELINKNYSSYDITKYFNKSQSSIRFWLKKYNLKTNFKFREGGWTNKQNAVIQNKNWDEIQKFYDSNHSLRDVSNYFNICRSTVSKAVKLRLIKTRPYYETSKLKQKPKKHSPETKKKLSIARTNYLLNHPGAKCWQKRDTKDSIPCKKVKELLISKNIKFIEEFEPLLHLGRLFSIDIAFPEKKIGIEINGRQHYDINGNLTLYFQERHNLIENEGWKLYEIPYHIAFQADKILELIYKILNSENKINFDYKIYQPRTKTIKPRIVLKHKIDNQYPTKYQYPPIEKLKIMGHSMTLLEIEKQLNIPKRALWSYLNTHKIKTQSSKNGSDMSN